jgi:NADPH:quinone reductase-like Zn-dependent oxidoreductase
VGTLIKHKAYSVIGGPRYEFLSAVNDDHLPFIASLLEKGIAPDVEKVMPMEKIAEAHEAIETHHGKGKIVLVVDSE